MRFPNLGIRHRILAACLVISLAAITAMAVFGLSMRGVLRARARESCICIAELFAAQAHQRLLTLAGESAVLAKLLPHSGEDAPPELAGPVALCAWTVYDGDGRRRLAQRSRRHEAALEAVGIGTACVVERERGRFAEALAGRPSTVLVPGTDRVYALVYRPVRRPDGQTRVLQAAMLAADAEFQAGACGDVRAVLRPFVEAADKPHLVTVDGRLRMVVHRPLMLCGRQLGTVSAAVPYDAEARCAQGVAVAIVIIAAGATLILAVLSYVLTDVAMVPLEHIRSLVCDRQGGAAVERQGQVPDDAVGSILEGYQEMIDQAQEFADRLMESNRALSDLLTGSVGALVSTIEAKDGYTAGHSQRVADTACSIARALGWSHRAIEQLRLGALLHDVGKIGISQDILNKPGGLSAEEWEVIRQHPVIGARILSSLPDCDDIVRIILHHHEYIDGSGYPAGIGGDDIPPAARIAAIADVYDALTSKRSYRDAYDPADAIAIIEESAGTTLDAEMVAAFLDLLRRSEGSRRPEPVGGSKQAEADATVDGASPPRCLPTPTTRGTDAPPTAPSEQRIPAAEPALAASGKDAQ